MSREPKQRQLAWQDLDGAAHVRAIQVFGSLAQVGSLKFSKHKYDINIKEFLLLIAPSS